jgi:hypothetical protein
VREGVRCGQGKVAVGQRRPSQSLRRGMPKCLQVVVRVVEEVLLL